MRAFRELHFLKLVEIIRNATSALPTWSSLPRLRKLLAVDAWHLYALGSQKSQRAEMDGVDAVLTANNHAYDFSEGGFLTTLRHLEEVDLPHAGGGRIWTIPGPRRMWTRHAGGSL